MQTFLPYSEFPRTAVVLDRQRLGKQRVEVLQLLNALVGISTGWRNHPATKMWAGSEFWLVRYGISICDEWIRRGYKDTCRAKIVSLAEGVEMRKPPKWLGDEAFHRSHRAALLFKNFDHYRKFGWTEEPEINYVWPV